MTAANGGDEPAAKHAQLRQALGPCIGYMTTIVEFGVLKAFIDWKVFDHIPDEGIALPDLAQKIHGQVELLERLSAYLVSAGFLEASAPGRVAHTAKSRLFKSDQITAGFLTHLHNMLFRPMAQFPAFLDKHGFSSPRNARVTPFGLATGHPNEDVYQILAAEPKLGHEFNSIVGRAGKVNSMSGVYDFSWAKPTVTAAIARGDSRPVFVDIGGSSGAALRDVLRDHPWIPANLAAVFDLPTTIAETKAGLHEELKSVRLVGGSVFESFPAPVQGSLIYQLRRILNDFPDDDVRRAWKALSEAAAPDTRVYVVEELLQSNRSAFSVSQDLTFMLVGGKRRDADMHAALAGEYGFVLKKKFADTYNDCSVLEFGKA